MRRSVRDSGAAALQSTTLKQATEEPVRAAIWARVSTTEQELGAEEADSLELGAGEADVLKLGGGEVGLLEPGAAEGGSVDLGASEVGAWSWARAKLASWSWVSAKSTSPDAYCEARGKAGGAGGQQEWFVR